MKFLFWLTFILTVISCRKSVDYYKTPLLSINSNLNAVIEIPAGTNKKFEYNKTTKSFEIDKTDGQDRIINFLPYLANYGFIPSTYSDLKKGGDGDPLDVLVLSESTPTGTIIEIKPIAMLKLLDNGEQDYKVIAIPHDINQRILDIKNLEELTIRFPEIKKMIELWFLNYNKKDEAIINGWANERATLEEIFKNKLK
jgi:inorganic pyrophosphatase